MPMPVSGPFAGHRASPKAEAPLASAAVDEAISCNKKLDRISCTPLPIEKGVL